jgi:hypothetical protein
MDHTNDSANDYDYDHDHDHNHDHNDSGASFRNLENQVDGFRRGCS